VPATAAGGGVSGGGSSGSGNLTEDQLRRLNEEFRLNGEDKETADNEALFYSIVRAMQVLERLYIQINTDEEQKHYQHLCETLLKQWKKCAKLVNMNHNDISRFFSERGLGSDKHYNLAVERFKEDRPAAFESLGNRFGATADALMDLQTIIEAVDQAKGVEELSPFISGTRKNLQNSLAPPDHLSRTNIEKWFEILSGRQGAEELTDAETANLKHDCNNAMVALRALMSGKQ